MTENHKKSDKSSKMSGIFMIILMTVIGFFIGKIDFEKNLETQIIEQEISREIAIVNLAKIEGDQIFAEISGPVKITWADSFS